MLQLQDADLITVKRGPGGITLNRPLSEITFLDVYRAVETNSDENLFRFHENPNPACPVGRTIQVSLDGELNDIQKDFEEDLSRRTVEDVYENIVRANKGA